MDFVFFIKIEVTTTLILLLTSLIFACRLHFQDVIFCYRVTCYFSLNHTNLLSQNQFSVAKATLHSQMSVRLSVTKPLIQLNINHSILHHHYNNTPHPHFIFTTSYNCHSPSFKRLYFNTITSPLFFNHLTIIIHHPSIPYIIAMFSPSICQVSKV